MKPVESITPRLAPAWVAFVSVWLGVLMLLASIVFPLLPGSTHPRAELEHLRPYSFADRFLPFPIYGIAVTLFLSSIVLWQMRKEPRPLPAALFNQRLQALVAIFLSLLAGGILYAWIALHGPRHA